MENKTLVRIPFVGFYESLLDSEIDHEIEQACEWQNSEDNDNVDGNSRGIPEGVYSELLYKFTDFEACHKQIARDYVDEFENLINEEFDTSMSLDFENMESPQFYNYTTDKIYVYVDREKMHELFGLCTPLFFQKTVDYHLKSRPGFISFYSEFVNEWKTKPFEEWDCNELSMIFYCLLSDVDDYDLTIYYKLSDNSIYSAFQNCVNWAKVEDAVDEYIKENPAEEVNDNRVFPSGNLSTNNYVNKFIALNNLKA